MATLFLTCFMRPLFGQTLSLFLQMLAVPVLLPYSLRSCKVTELLLGRPLLHHLLHFFFVLHSREFIPIHVTIHGLWLNANCQSTTSCNLIIGQPNVDGLTT